MVQILFIYDENGKTLLYLSILKCVNVKLHYDYYDHYDKFIP